MDTATQSPKELSSGSEQFQRALFEKVLAELRINSAEISFDRQQSGLIALGATDFCGSIRLELKSFDLRIIKQPADLGHTCEIYSKGSDKPALKVDGEKVNQIAEIVLTRFQDSEAGKEFLAKHGRVLLGYNLIEDLLVDKLSVNSETKWIHAASSPAEAKPSERFHRYTMQLEGSDGRTYEFAATRRYGEEIAGLVPFRDSLVASLVESDGKGIPTTRTLLIDHSNLASSVYTRAAKSAA